MAKQIRIEEITQNQFEFMTDLNEIEHQERMYEIDMETMNLIAYISDIENWYSD